MRSQGTHSVRGACRILEDLAALCANYHTLTTTGPCRVSTETCCRSGEHTQAELLTGHAVIQCGSWPSIPARARTLFAPRRTHVFLLAFISAQQHKAFFIDRRLFSSPQATGEASLHAYNIEESAETCHVHFCTSQPHTCHSLDTPDLFYKGPRAAGDAFL